ncbi:MAG: translation initiation factor IF-2 [Patescibacteria group bacterium]
MENKSKIERPPVVVVLGHVDHGKSTLLDYIRSANTVEREAGGITQHTAAYEVTSEYEGAQKRITFIDTPGHAAFGKMRERGAAVADIAILVVAADDGVKPQTLEALEAIRLASIPFIVAINKTDKPNSNIERTKQSLAEAGVLVEDYGGTVPVAEISAKTGEGIDNLLSLILLSASLEELTYDQDSMGKGVVIESHRDLKRGILATLVVTEGKLSGGDVVLIDSSVSVLRAIENWESKKLEVAIPSMPVVASGFSDLPQAGSEFEIFANKKEAEKEAEKRKVEVKINSVEKIEKEIIIPIILKADATGTLEAIKSELTKQETEKVGVKFVDSGVGAITESDVKILRSSDKPIIIGFNVSIDKHAKDSAEKNGVRIELFDIIYKLSEWFGEYVDEITPKVVIETITGEAKVLKTFSRTRERQVLGGIVKSGSLERGKKVRISRRDEMVGEGKIVNLQKSRNDTDSVSEGEQFGAVIEAKLAIAEGDIVQIISRS